MAELARVRVEINWAEGGPGVCTYYCSGGIPNPLDWGTTVEQFLSELEDVWDAYRSTMFNTVGYVISRDIDVINVESGNIIDQFTVDGAPHNNTGSFADQSGSRGLQMYTRFKTDKYENGRRLAGGTFIGPMGAGALGDDYKWSRTQKLTVEDAWWALTHGVGPRLAVYHRPKKGQSTGGYYGDVTSVRLMEKPANLRSRRD